MAFLYDLTSDFEFVPKGKKKEDEFKYLTDTWESTLPPLPSENIGSPVTSGFSESPLPWQEEIAADPYAGMLPDENTWGGAPVLPDQSSEFSFADMPGFSDQGMEWELPDQSSPLMDEFRLADQASMEGLPDELTNPYAQYDAYIQQYGIPDPNDPRSNPNVAQELQYGSASSGGNPVTVVATGQLKDWGVPGANIIGPAIGTLADAATYGALSGSGGGNEDVGSLGLWGEAGFAAVNAGSLGLGKGLPGLGRNAAGNVTGNLAATYVPRGLEEYSQTELPGADIAGNPYVQTGAAITAALPAFMAGYKSPEIVKGIGRGVKVSVENADVAARGLDARINEPAFERVGQASSQPMVFKKGRIPGDERTVIPDSAAIRKAHPERQQLTDEYWEKMREMEARGATREEKVALRDSYDELMPVGPQPLANQRLWFHSTRDTTYDLPDPDKAVGGQTGITQGPGVYMAADPAKSAGRYGDRTFVSEFDGNVLDLTKKMAPDEPIFEGGPSWADAQASLSRELAMAGIAPNEVAQALTSNYLRMVESLGRSELRGRGEALNGYNYRDALAEAAQRDYFQANHAPPVSNPSLNARTAMKSALGPFGEVVDSNPNGVGMAAVNRVLKDNGVDALFHHSPRADGDVLIVLNGDKARALGEVRNGVDIVKGGQTWREMVGKAFPQRGGSQPSTISQPGYDWIERGGEGIGLIRANSDNTWTAERYVKNPLRKSEEGLFATKADAHKWISQSEYGRGTSLQSFGRAKPRIDEQGNTVAGMAVDRPGRKPGVVPKKVKQDPLESLPSETQGPLLAAADELGMTPEQVGAAVRSDPEGFAAIVDEAVGRPVTPEAANSFASIQKTQDALRAANPQIRTEWDAAKAHADSVAEARIAEIREPAIPGRFAALEEKVNAGAATPSEEAVVSSVKRRTGAATKAEAAEADREVADDLARVIMEDASSGEPPKSPPRVTGKAPQEPEGGKPTPPEDDARRYLREQREQRDAGVVEALKKRNQGRQFGEVNARFKEGYENGLRGEELDAYAMKGAEGGLGETGITPLSDEGIVYVREQVQEAYRAGKINDAQYLEAIDGIRQSVGNGWIEPKQLTLLESIVGKNIAESMAARDLSGGGLGTDARPIPRREGVDDLEFRTQPQMDEPSGTAAYESQILQERAAYREWVANQRPAANQPAARSILDASKNPEATAGHGDMAGRDRLARDAALAEGASKRDAERFAAWVAEKRAQPPREGADQLSFGDEALYGTPVVNPSGVRATGEPTYTELRDSWRSAAKAANEAELAARAPGADELAKTRAERARRGANEAKAALDRATPESRATHRAALDAAAAEPTPESIEKAARSLGFKIVRTGYSVTIETLLGSKAIKASLDLSAMLRQGALVGGAHPKIAAKAFGKQFEGWKSKQGYDDVMEDLANSHNASWHEEGGLAVTDTLTKSEEQFTGHFVEKMNLHNLPGVAGRVGQKISDARIGPVPIGKALDLGDAVAASSRAYSALLNYMRVHVFDTVWDNLPDSAKTTERAKALSGLINASTGRGALPARLGSNNKILNTIFFAPRYVVSRPEFVYRAGKLAVTDKYLRGEALKQLTGYFAATGTLMALGVAAYEASDGKAGWQVDMNPKSGNFGNMKIGPVSFDPWGGFSQIAKLAIQASTAEKYSGNSGANRDLSRFLKYGPAKEPVGRFARGKLSPAASLYTSLQSGRDFDGNKISTDPIGLLSDLAEPLSFSEMRKAWLEYDLKTALMTLPGYLGVGVNVQPKDNYEIASKAAYEEFDPKTETGVSYEKPERAYWDPLFKRLFNEKNPDIEPEVKGERAEKSRDLLKEYEVKQAENTRQFAAGEIDVGDWKDWRSTLSYAKVQEREQILGEFVGADPPKDTPAYWVKTYTDTFVRLPDDKLDRDATQAKQNEWVKEYGPDALAYVNAFYAADKTPEDKAYIKAMQTIGGDGYFDREKMPKYKGMPDGIDEVDAERLEAVVGYERNKSPENEAAFEKMDWSKSAMLILQNEGYSIKEIEAVIIVHKANLGIQAIRDGRMPSLDVISLINPKRLQYEEAHPKETAWLNDSYTYDQMLEIYGGSFESD